jgi:hypothetical protein
MTMLCWLLLAAGIAVAVTVFLWAASVVSGGHADAETPIEE